MIVDEDEPVAGQNRRGSFAECHPHAHLNSKVFLPDQVALHVEAIHAARTKKRIDMFAVGDRRVGGEAAVGRVESLMRRRGFSRTLPEDLSGFPVQAENIEPVLCLQAGAAAEAAAWIRACCRGC